MLAEKWSNQRKVRQFTVPTTVRLRPAVDCALQDLQCEFPHLTVTQIINDLLEDAISRVNSQR